VVNILLMPFPGRKSQWLLPTILVMIFAGCGSKRVEQRELPLPTLPNGSIELRVAYAVNPRLPRMTPEQLQLLLESTQTAAREHFGVEVHFAPVNEIPIETLFKKIPEKIRQDFSKQIYEFKSGKSYSEILEKNFGEGLREEGEPLEAQIEYAKPYTGTLQENSYEALGAATAKLQLSLIERWKTVEALDGAPAIDDSPYNEYMMWLALGYGDVPYELVLTNQLIVSVEHINPSVHTAIRGGYSNGITSYSKQSRYGTYSTWSTFAFSSNDEWVKLLRNGESYSPIEAAKLSGIAATHELGHQLFHIMHPYGNIACLMNPVPMFAYRDWEKKLSANACPLGSSPELTPGVYKFFY
jgi:hypothetical protein